MALAIFGSPTKISRASSGRSTIIERPTPSCRFFVWPLATVIEAAGRGLPDPAAAGPYAPSPPTSARAASPFVQALALRTAPVLSLLRFMEASSAGRLLRRAVAHDGQTAGLRFRRVIDGLRAAGAVDERAQHQIEMGARHVLGVEDDLGLLGIEFQRGVAADHNLLAVQILHVLPDRQHAHVGEHGLMRQHFRTAGAGGLLV